MVTKIHEQHISRKRGRAVRAKATMPVMPPRASAVSRDETKQYEQQLAERSPLMSDDARHFLAQMRAQPGYRAVMRDLADK